LFWRNPEITGETSNFGIFQITSYEDCAAYSTIYTQRIAKGSKPWRSGATRAAFIVFYAIKIAIVNVNRSLKF
jgi:hypothetical protein